MKCHHWRVHPENLGMWLLRRHHATMIGCLACCLAAASPAQQLPPPLTERIHHLQFEYAAHPAGPVGLEASEERLGVIDVNVAAIMASPEISALPILAALLSDETVVVSPSPAEQVLLGEDLGVREGVEPGHSVSRGYGVHGVIRVRDKASAIIGHWLAAYFDEFGERGTVVWHSSFGESVGDRIDPVAFRAWLDEHLSDLEIVHSRQWQRPVMVLRQDQRTRLLF